MEAIEDFGRFWIYLSAEKNCVWKYYKEIDSKFVRKAKFCDEYKYNIIQSICDVYQSAKAANETQ